jgi:hypothetical protein
MSNELRQAAQAFADAWVSVCNAHGWEPEHISQYVALRAALAQPQFKPVAQFHAHHADWQYNITLLPGVPMLPDKAMLYTAPPQRTLSDAERDAITHELNQARCLEGRTVGNIELTERIARAVERAHGIGADHE